MLRLYYYYVYTCKDNWNVRNTQMCLTRRFEDDEHDKLPYLAQSIICG